MDEQSVSQEEQAPTQPESSASQRAHFAPWQWLTLVVLLAFASASFLWSALQQQQMITTLTNQQRATQQQVAQAQQQETILQNYMDKISDLLVHDKLLQANKADPARIAANAYTHEALPRLDSSRKAELMSFLYQTKLISNDTPIIDLQDVDIHGASMQNRDIRDTYLVGANLNGANLSGATLSNALLIFTNLNNANLAHANLQGCDMHNTNLQNANLAGANLRDVAGLQDSQLTLVKSLAGATMPDGSVHR